MNKKNGFTLIEIIGAIIILSIIAIIAFATYTSSLKGFRENYYTSLEQTLAKTGEEFFGDNRSYRPNGILIARHVTISTLATKNYVSKVVDYNGDPCSEESYVMVVKEGKDNYSYHTCLKCGKDGYDNTKNDKYCDQTWLDPTRVEYGLGDLDDIYIYKGTTREDLKEQLEVTVSYIRKNNEGEIIGEAKGSKEGDPIIYPNNIDVVNTDVVSDDPYIVEYEYKGVHKRRNVYVFENDEPNIRITTDITSLKNISGQSKLQTGVEYTSGTWVQNITVYLNSNEFDDSELRTSRFQWNKNGRWQDFCETDPCTKRVTEEMNQTIQFRIVDTHGNISKLTEPIVIRIDNTAPTCSLTIPTTIGEHEWYNTDVTIQFATKTDREGNDPDAISGIEYYNILQSTVNLDAAGKNYRTQKIASTVLDVDMSSVVYTGFVIDKAQNFVVCSTPTFKRDATLPDCDDSGDSTTWVNTNRTIKWLCVDPTSNGTKSGCNPSFSGGERTYTTTTKTASIASYTIKDMAGNQKVCPQRTANVYVDIIPPTCTDSGDSTTYAASRVINYGCSDADSKCDPSYSGGSVTFNTTTTLQSTIAAYTIKDIAGNETACSQRTADVYVDKTAPTCTNRGDNSEWKTGSVTIYYGCNDTNSGCATAEKNTVFTSSTKTATIAAYTIKDNVGNETTCPERTANIYLDNTDPSCITTGESTTWTHDDRTIGYVCKDDHSGCNPSYSGGSQTFTTTTKTAEMGPYTIKDNLGHETTCAKRSVNVYVSKTVTCSAGNYLPKNSKDCATCPENHYCGGGTYNTYQSSDQGKTACESGYSCGTGKSSKGSCCKTTTRNCCSAGTRFDDSSSVCVNQDYYNGPECGVGWECVYGTNQHCYDNAIAWHPTGGCYGTNCWCMNPVGSWGPYCSGTVCQE